MVRKLTQAPTGMGNVILLKYELRLNFCMKKIVVTLAIFGTLLVQSQNKFGFDYTGIYKLIENGDSLQHAWAGGLNQPQFSKVDLNLDGTMDLIAFDRSGHRLVPFLQVNNGGTPKYKYAPEYKKYFPTIEYWLLFADYNCDGKQDIFCYIPGGIGVYENISDTVLKFQWALPSNNLKSDYGTGPINLYVFNVDLPGIADVDFDGDLDIFTFGQGNTVQFHENQTPCGLDFAINTWCWGRFEEGFLTNTVTLDACQGVPKKEFTGHAASNKVQHAGSTSLIVDFNGDSLHDVLLGDVSYNNGIAAFNTGTRDSAFMSSQDTMFPGYDKPIDLYIFPAFFYEDVDFDNKKDLIAAPNQQLGAKNLNSIWMYKNTGTNMNPVFDFQDSAFMQRQMVDLGEGATPTLVDMNTDGLLDLVIGNYGVLQDDGNYRSFLSYYKNTGTLNDPKFELVDADLANISTLNIGEGLNATFGDLDGDIDPDMIVGAVDGKLYYFENTGSFTSPNFVLTTPNFQNIDVGGSSAPFLFDMDDDGDLDLLIGEEDGNLNYYSNDGTTPLSFTLVNEQFGGVNVRSRFTNTGYSVPRVTENNDTLNLFVGSYDRGIVQYDSISSVMNKPAEVDEQVGNGTTISSNTNVTPFGASKRNGRSQILYRASDLLAEGFTYGKITELAFNIPTFPGNIITQGFTIKMKNTTSNTVTTWEDTGFTQVFDFLYGFSSGWNNIQLSTPFLWDGSSNLLIEICFSKNFQSSDLHVECTDVGYDANAYGDVNNWNGVTQDGCEMPYLAASTLRPNIQLTLIPTFVESEVVMLDGWRNAAAFGNLNGDQYMDAILGNYSGGISFMQGVEWTAPPFAIREYAWQEVEGINAYPNPTENTLVVELPESIKIQKTKVELYDITGRQVYMQDATAKEQILNVSQLQSGIYILTVHDGKQRFNERIVIQR